MILSLDWETRSAADLRKTGVHRYAQDPSTGIWCACYAFDDEPVESWIPGYPCPSRVTRHVTEGGTISGWNVAFERIIWQYVAGPRHGWPMPALEQFDDTAAWGAAMGLPRALDDAAAVMKSAHLKDEAGARLMKQMMRPRKRHADGTFTWWDDDPAKLDRLIDYCVKDVEAERALRKILVPLSPAEREVYLLDQRINDRGVWINTDLVRAMLKITEEAKAGLDEEMARLTGWEVTGCSKVVGLGSWLRGRGVPAESLAKAALADLLLDETLPDDARRVLELRQDAAKSSTAKLVAMLTCVSADGTAKGLHLYHGASTGRWGGRLIQTQNMPRGTGTVKDPEAAIPDMMRGDADWIELIYGRPLFAVSDCLRACIQARPGNRLLVADYSAIEGRVTAWLAGEAWKLDAFRAADAGEGAGIYELTAAGILGKLVEQITKAERQAYGKVPELALGYQGGVVAFNSMAKIYDVDMAEAYDPLWQTTDAETWAKAEKRYELCCERGDTGVDVLSREAWIASEVTKVLWRRKHPATVALWGALEGAAFDAVRNPGKVYADRGISYVVKRGFLWCKLPSGRCLAYGAPRIKRQVWVRQKGMEATESMDLLEAEKLQRMGLLEILREAKGAITALGVDSVTRKYRRFGLYGGLATENCVQAIARDILANGLLKAEALGFSTVMHVHDEAVADMPEGTGSLAEFEAALCDLPYWAAGLPMVAEGYEAKVYRK